MHTKVFQRGTTKTYHSFIWSTSSFRQIPSTPLFSGFSHHHSCIARTSSGSCLTSALFCPAALASRHVIIAHTVPFGRFEHLPRSQPHKLYRSRKLLKKKEEESFTNKMYQPLCISWMRSKLRIRWLPVLFALNSPV